MTMAHKVDLNRSTIDDDPSDWPKEFQELRILDSLLRCSICFEYFNIAVLATGCCHNYCSLCARKYITYKAQCPCCPAEMHQKDLKCNRVLDEIVKIVNLLRPKLLKLFREHAEMLKNRNPCTSEGPPSKSSFAKGQPAKRENTRKQSITQKILQDPDLIQEPEENTAYCSTTSDDDFVKDRTRNRLNLNRGTDFRSGSSTSTLTESDFESLAENENSSSTKQSSKGVENTVCPICGKEFSVRQINPHLDICLIKSEKRKNTRSCSTASAARPVSKRLRGRGKMADNKCLGESTISRPPKTEESSRIKLEEILSTAESNVSCSENEIHSPGVCSRSSEATMKRTASNHLLPMDVAEKRKRLPELCLSGLTDKQLRAKLKSYGLNARGDKKTLQNRLKNFTVLFNSQCDAANPMPISDIVNEVERVESTRKRLDTKGTTVIHTFDRTKTDEEKEKFSENYMSKHKDHFEQLIQDVKQRKRKTKAENGNTDVTMLSDGLARDEGPKYSARNSKTAEVSSTFVENANVDEESGGEECQIEGVGRSSDLHGSPRKPILICDEDLEGECMTGNAVMADNGRRPTGCLQTLSTSAMARSPESRGNSSVRNQGLASKLKNKQLESARKGKQKQAKLSSSVKKPKTIFSASKLPSSQTTRTSTSKNNKEKKLKAKNITSFFERAKSQKSDVSMAETTKNVEVDLCTDSGEEKIFDSANDMAVDETGSQGSQSILRRSQTDVKNELVSKPPSVDDLELFGNEEYSPTMEL